MKNNNKLTLKSLQQELENLKVKSTVKSRKPEVTEKVTKGGHEIKNSYINNLYSKSSGFMLYLVTGLLAYGSKIPYIKRIVSFLALIYGRTTIWKFLVYLRKFFIIINAIIGVYVVFKAVGFSTDNLIIGWVALGEAYFLALGNIVSKLFKWFVELFDYKIVPNIPGGNDDGSIFGSKRKYSWGDPVDVWKESRIQRVIDSSNDNRYWFLKGTTIDTYTPWYKDYSTWLWIVGGACTLGIAYLGYKIVFDPTYISNLLGIDNTPTINTQPPTPPFDPNNQAGPSTIATIAAGVTGVTKSVSALYFKTVNILNPFHYFGTNSETANLLNNFMEMQNDPVRANRKLYPFTEHNPLDSWFKKVRIGYFGETLYEKAQRIRDMAMADSLYDEIKVNKGKGKAIDTSNYSSLLSTRVSSPIVGNLGLLPTTAEFVENLEVAKTSAAISPLNLSTVNLPVITEGINNEIVNTNIEWQNKIASNTEVNVPTPSGVESEEAEWKTMNKRIKALRTKEPFEIHTNPFDGLSID